MEVQKTYTAKPGDISQKWWVIDAQDLVLGRLASKISMLLRGKHKPYYSTNLDCGDYVIVVNADKVHITGKKAEQTKFFWHTGYPGGIKEITQGQELAGRFPERVLYRAIERMMPKHTVLGKQQIKKLYLYNGDKHPHDAQKPEVYSFAEANAKNKRRAAA